MDSKVELEAKTAHFEHVSQVPVDPKAGDAALEVLGDSRIHYEVTIEDDHRVLSKIDRWIMPIMLVVYSLQQLDKSSVSYTSVFGIIEDTHLVGFQYSWLTSIVYLAQLVWQPVSSYFLVRLPIAKYLAVHVFMWGVCVASSAAAHNFQGLIAARFFLGIFEATVAPCFITITQMWWRRREQTMRLSMWYAANGVTGMFGSLLAWGVGHISGSLRPYQVIFLFIGCISLGVAPFVWLILPDSPTKARFLSNDEKIVAVERLRANNQGTESKIWKWSQALEVLIDPKSYMWFAFMFLCALPSGGISAFGPLIIQGFGFNQFTTILFNIPFSAIQVVVTLSSAWISTRIKLKWPVVFFLTLPPIAGAIALLKLGRTADLRNRLLGCYYVISFYTGIQPMLYTWASQNTAGHTKKLCTTGLFFVAQCAGNIVGPLLYTTAEKPYYRRGLIADLICWSALAGLVLVAVVYLSWLNARHAARRVALGKPAVVIDRSLEKFRGTRTNADEKDATNDQAFDDLTDLQNEDFIYVL
ncbi:major facilitator superfamily domain-containing protein [Vararia minispora EC-137]|uniref:Major facilitator superfamily domain-containing protein n=1 Tax=Vararia minispora EC-137 TaxID=1314806 RepID=A0ACB8QPK5_9AGAM|nr:major facilitator superfamily domain-containing protein [Vararia minispora EC-137]